MNYIDRLISNCNIAKKSTPSRNFILDDIADLDGMKQAIYIIEEVGGDTENTYLQFSLFKEKRPGSVPN